MGFFQRVKELAKLRETILQELAKLDSMVAKSIELQSNNSKLELALSNKEATMKDIRDILEAENVEKRESLINQGKKDAALLVTNAEAEVADLRLFISENEDKISTLTEERDSLTKEINRYLRQARKFKSEIVGLKKYHKRFNTGSQSDYDTFEDQLFEASEYLETDGLIDTIIKLPLHSDNSKDLRKLSNETRKEINNVLEKYKDRYNTKANKAIYQLMVIGLQAEMQLLLFQLGYQKLNEAKEKVSLIFNKYTTIAAEGNRSILPTITRFITEIEPLYIELVDIEYRYYIKRQKEKEEQQAIREQMKQEREEQQALAAERKKLEKEEYKYQTEMKRNKELLAGETDTAKIAQLEEHLKELQQQLDSVAEKKEEVTSLALGKAGYVYVISNLGSFGENVFKIGMTRRLEPQQRIDELGSASVPFKFDVHALIFSDDAVNLENTLHKRLSDNRVNKVNYRKEFFRSSVDDLEKLVEEIDPTAEFTKTMFAEEYQQTRVMEDNTETIFLDESLHTEDAHLLSKEVV